jgi:hypothetical protein
VGEAHADLGRLQHPRRDRPLGRVEQRPFPGLAHRRPHVERHLLAEDRRDREQPPVLVAQPGQPPRDDLPQQRRHRHRRQIAERPPLALPAQRARPFERPQQLAQEERVPIAAPGQIPREVTTIRRA